MALPVSTSGFLKLDGIDIKKTLRMAFVVFVGAFCAKLSLVTDLTNADLQMVFTDAAQAGLAAVGAASVELIRRYLTNHQG